MTPNTTPKTIFFNGIPYVETPYERGVYLRPRTFWRQLTVTCYGQAEYPEDDPVYGTWWTSSTIILGECGLIEQAMALALRCVEEHDFDTEDDSEALSFSPEQVRVHDTQHRLVLAGEVVSSGIQWSVPVAHDGEVQAIVEQARRLSAEASIEHGWDNYCTAKGLSLQSSIVQGRLVDRFWRAHARQALQIASA